MSRAVVLDAFPALDSLKSSSRSNGVGAPPKKPFKNDCFGGSGRSFGELYTEPTMSGKFSQKLDEIVNFVSSDGEDKYIPCPLTLNTNVRAILN